MPAVIADRLGKGAAVRQALIALLVFVMAGAVAGALWFWLWSPAPETSAYLIDGGRPFFDDDLEFRSTGIYLVVAVPLGLVLGALFMWIHDRDELFTLGVVAVAAVAAGLVMVGVGALLGPGQPESIDVTVAHPDGFPTAKAALEASPVAWFLGFPGGALVGCVLVLVGFPGDAAPRRVDPGAVDVPAAAGSGAEQPHEPFNAQ